MPAIIEIMGDAACLTELPYRPCYLRAADFNKHGGLGEFEFTPMKGRAKRFETKAEAMIFWATQSTVKPLRPDGRPNKPLTMYHVSVTEVET